MPIENDLDFVTVQSLISYGEAMVNAPRAEGSYPPPRPSPSNDRVLKVESAKEDIMRFVSKTRKGLPTAEAYRRERQSIIDRSCGGDALVFYRDIIKIYY